MLHLLPGLQFPALPTPTDDMTFAALTDKPEEAAYPTANTFPAKEVQAVAGSVAITQPAIRSISKNSFTYTSFTLGQFH